MLEESRIKGRVTLNLACGSATFAQVPPDCSSWKGFLASGQDVNSEFSGQLLKSPFRVSVRPPLPPPIPNDRQPHHLCRLGSLLRACSGTPALARV